MDIAKLAWQAQIAKRHFDRRTIAVPESMKGGDPIGLRQDELPFAFFNGNAWGYTYPSKPHRFIAPIYPSAKIVRGKALFKREIDHLKELGYTLEGCLLLDEKYLNQTWEWWLSHRNGQIPSE